MTDSTALTEARTLTARLDALAREQQETARLRRAVIDLLYHDGYSYGAIGEMLCPEAPLSRQAVRILHVRFLEEDQ